MADKTVLTTGANSGIGLATVIEVARRGFRSVGSVRTEEKGDVVAKAAADAGVSVETVLADRPCRVIIESSPDGPDRTPTRERVAYAGADHA